jgi:hypothetical protein
MKTEQLYSLAMTEDKNQRKRRKLVSTRPKSSDLDNTKREKQAAQQDMKN